VVPAEDRGGGCLALYRHFYERRDFEMAVASRFLQRGVCEQEYLMRVPRLWALARKTPLGRLLENIDYLRAERILPAGLLKFARRWQPDLIFSVADDLHAMIGYRLARQLTIPYVVDFQDLFAYSNFNSKKQRPYRLLKALLLTRYRKLQSEADAVFHTSKGMREWFGTSARGDVLYPIGATDINGRQTEHAPPVDRLTLVYAGNCYGPYGAMMRKLAQLLIGHSHLSLAVYSMGVDWPAGDIARFTRAGIYHGFVPFHQLEQKLIRADAFLVAMSFRPEDRTFVETSFTTKWLDYAACARPILVWAPAYSTAARFARETGAGLLVDDPAPAAVVGAAEALMLDPNRWNAAANAAAQASADDLNSERLHALLRSTLCALIDPSRDPRTKACPNDQSL